MDSLQAIILALVQGLTEFLPVSSSAHLCLGPRLLGGPDQGLEDRQSVGWVMFRMNGISRYESRDGLGRAKQDARAESTWMCGAIASVL